MAKQRMIPRGIRNNNPLNIRIGNVWLGEVQNPTDPNFEQFVSMAYGIRAAFVLLRRYIKHYRRTTIPDVVAAWAPAVENNVQRYVDVVTQLAGITADTQLIYEDKVMMCRLVDAMIFHECAQHVDFKVIERAYDMA